MALRFLIYMIILGKITTYFTQIKQCFMDLCILIRFSFTNANYVVFIERHN